MADGGSGVLRISVALCTYNGVRFLPEQLKSFSEQQRLPDEIIICDDGSTDGTYELLEVFARSAPFSVQLHRNAEKLGYSRNFRKAVALCSGDVIALSDQDDIWYTSKLLRLEQEFVAHPDAGGVFSNGDLIDADSHLSPGSLWESFRFTRRDQSRIAQGHAVEVLLQRNVVTGMAFAFRAVWSHLFEQMPDHWPHDFWLALMLGAEGRLWPCAERLVAYRVHHHQQVGVPITRAEKVRFLRRNGLRAYLELSRNRNLREYGKDALQFESLLARADQDVAFRSAWWLPLARRKAEHMRRVVRQLETSRLRRWPSALRHWRSYVRYAPTGLSAFVRDLLL